MKKVGSPPHVIEHCKKVTHIATRIANIYIEKGYKINLELIEAGALLHDIGRSQTHNIDHSAKGGEIAKELGLSDPIVRIIIRHIGAGIPDDEANELGLPKNDYIPESLEEKIVSYADKLIVAGREVDIEVTIEDFIDELGPNHPAINRLRKLHEEIASVIGNKF
jgi:uncharacterized protein